MRATGTNLLEVHGARKKIVKNMPIEKEKTPDTRETGR